MMFKPSDNLPNATPIEMAEIVVLPCCCGVCVVDLARFGNGQSSESRPDLDRTPNSAVAGSALSATRLLGRLIGWFKGALRPVS